MRSTVSSPWRRAQQRHHRRAGGERLETAAVAAAADQPVLVDEHVPDLPGRAAVPVVRAPVDDQARADARGHLHVGGGAPPLRRPESPRRARRGWRRCRGARGSRSCSAARRPRPRRPSPKDRARGKRAARVVDRARQRHAHADHLPLVHAPLVEHPRDQLGSLLERSVGVLVHVHPGARLGDHGAGEVAHRHADLVVVEVEADGGAGRRVERELRGRAPWRPAGASVLSTTRPARWSSPITDETVDGDRPVCRAMSARLAGPSWRRASTMRNRLSSRSDPSDPDIAGATLVSDDGLSRVCKKQSLNTPGFSEAPRKSPR